MGSILSLRIVSSWRTEEDEAPRPIWLKTCSVLISLYRCLKGVFLRIKPRKIAGALLPHQNPTPKPSDHRPLNRPLDSYTTSSTEMKSQESSEEKEREMKKVIQSTVVVEKTRWIKHYSSSHRILLVGEGDFSFSYSLAAAFGCASKMIATSLDSKEYLKKNYAKAPWNIGELKKRGCIVMHGIDATKMATQQLLQHKTFDRIIFNFPFAGFFKGLSRDSSLRRHRRLVSLFLKNSKQMIDEYGEIHISHKINGYHSEWNLVSIASSHGLRLIDEVEFDLSDYPGYNTKRGFGGDENFNCYPSNTFKFGLKLVAIDMHGKC